MVEANQGMAFWLFGKLGFEQVHLAWGQIATGVEWDCTV